MERESHDDDTSMEYGMMIMTILDMGTSTPM